jgi:hypothetical protein
MLLSFVWDKNTSPDAFTRFIISSLNASAAWPFDGFARKQTTLNGTGATRSNRGSASTQLANTCARRICSARRVRIPSAPKYRSTIHNFSARNRRPS